MDYINMFKSGDSPPLAVVLKNRETRVAYSKVLLEQSPNATLVSFKLNIPGPIKNNEYIYNLFESTIKDFLNTFDNDKIVFNRQINPSTGPEVFLLIAINEMEVKKLATSFEESPVGRLVDADVAYLLGDTVKVVSRADLALLQRKCFVCNEPAKTCAGRRLHSVEELQAKVVEIASNYKKD